MPAAPAFYLWKPAGKSISVHFDLTLIEKLRDAIFQARHSEPERRDEVGGILLGRVEPGENIIVDGFELVQSEHKRGASFTLSSRDCEKLDARLQWWSKHKDEHGPIGFFRSHTRSGLYLDPSDRQVISRFFSRTSDVALLVRPATDGACTAGCFFWEDGGIPGARTYLEFPFESRRLASQSYGRPLSQQPEPPPAFPVVTRVAKQRGGPIPVPAAVLAVLLLPLLALYAYRATTKRPQAPTVQSKLRAPAPVRHRAGPAVLGEANERANDSIGDRFDDSIDGLPVIEERVKLSAAKEQRDVQATATPSLLPAARARSPLAEVVRKPLKTDVPRADPFLPSPLEGKSPVHLAVAPTPAPNPRMSAVRAPLATVELEPVNESVVRRAVSHVPLVSVLQRHRFKAGERFTPARPVRDIAPAVPSELRSRISGAAPIELKITVDKTGSVAETELLSKKADSALAELAVRTASHWDFVPARINSRAVTSEMLVHMRFAGQTRP